MRIKIRAISLINLAMVFFITVKTSADEKNAGPDLVVTEAKVRQTKAGQPLVQPLVLDIVLKNQGTKPVLPGISIGASVYNVDSVPRKILGYTTNKKGLNPGSTLAFTVTCKKGYLSAGKHTIAIVADDVNRIPELDESNNIINIAIEVKAPPKEGPEKPRSPTTASTVPSKSQMPKRGLRRELQILKAVKGHRPELILIGDSITEFYNKQVWEKYYAQYDGMRFGFSGENTEHILGHIANGILDGQNPKVAILLIGTNNMGHNRSEKSEWVAKGIEAIVKAIHLKLPNTKVLVMGIFPRGSKAGDPMRAKVLAVNEIISKLDDGNNTRYVDIGHKFLNDKGDVKKDLMADWLHPTPKGYQVWAENIQPFLDQMMK